MKPDWDQLGDEFSASLSVLIGDVDCTRADDLLCKHQKVEEYPMLKVFYSGDVKGFEYQGDQDIDTLRAFIESHLEVKCKVSQFETDGHCSPKEREYIVAMKGKHICVDSPPSLSSLSLYVF
jgi:protein disulfide-isomerase A6